MWPAPPIREDVVSIIINANHLYCGWLQCDSKKRLQLSAFKVYALEHMNQLSLQHYLQDFIDENKLAHSFLSISLASPLIYEELIRLSKASPDPIDFQSKHFQQLLWNYHYLRALDDGNHLFYIKGIKKPSYFEYQLLAHKLNLKLITFTSMYASQLAAYAHYHGKAFRNAKLSLDLEKHQYKIAASLDRDAIARMLHVDTNASIATEVPEVLVAMIGSFYIESRSWQ